MEIICENCQSRFNLPDEKIPTDRTANLSCPKCKNKIPVGPRAAQSETETNHNEYDSSEKPFDFIEEEGDTALVCESDSKALKKIVNALNLMEYHITVAENSRDALKKMRYHPYDLVVVNESFNSEGPDTNMIMLYLERLNMTVRRDIFVAMISNNIRTMDQMLAFRYSVNIIINIKNIDDFATIIQRGLTDTELFYRIFIESLKETGRI